MKKHLKSKYLSISLVLILCFVCLSACSASSTDEKADLSKVDEKLLEQMDSVADDELIPISITLKGPDEASLEEMIRTEVGLQPSGASATLEAMNQYLSARNAIVRREQSAYNDAFVSAHVAKRQNEVTYASRTISSIFISAKKADIAYYSQLSEVTSIYYNDPSMVAVPT